MQILCLSMIHKTGRTKQQGSEEKRRLTAVLNWLQVQWMREKKLMIGIDCNNKFIGFFFFATEV